jgi:hypothetical protein
MTSKNSTPDATPPENQNGTIDISLDDACMAAAVAAQTELIDMLARLILQAIDNQAIANDAQTASPKKRPRTRRTTP